MERQQGYSGDAVSYYGYFCVLDVLFPPDLLSAKHLQRTGNGGPRKTAIKYAELNAEMFLADTFLRGRHRPVLASKLLMQPPLN